MVGWQDGLGKTSLLEMLGEGFPLPGGGWGQCGAGGCSAGMENPLCAHVCVCAHTYMLRVCLFLVSLGLSRIVTLPLSLSLSLSESLPVDPGRSVSLPAALPPHSLPFSTISPFPLLLSLSPSSPPFPLLPVFSLFPIGVCFSPSLSA